MRFLLLGDQEGYNLSAFGSFIPTTAIRIARGVWCVHVSCTSL